MPCTALKGLFKSHPGLKTEVLTQSTRPAENRSVNWGQWESYLTSKAGAVPPQ